MKTYSYGQTPAEVIASQFDKELGEKPYHFELVGDDVDVVVRIVNIGIDSHLEGITESKFSWGDSRRLVGDVSKKDMLVILRRLEEDGTDEAMDLRVSILCTLDIEEV